MAHALTPAVAQGEIVVRMETSGGNIDVELYDEQAPITVQNFLNYLRAGQYNSSFFHRSVPGFVIQAGGYRYVSGFYVEIPRSDPIVNEYDPSRSNLRGTIAMAKLSGDPDSATSEWFFNLDDNSANLDTQNGGFTVFGRVIGDGMTVVDAIANLRVWDASSLSPLYGYAFGEMPLIGYTGGEVQPETQLVMIYRVREILNVQGNQALVVNSAGNSIGLTAVAPATLANVTAIDNPAPDTAPAGVAFREGFFEFQVNDLTPGGSTQVALQLPGDYLPNTYYMYGPTPDNATPHWYEFKYNGRTGAEFFGNNYVVLHFVDGERGDGDLTVNGSIMDPGGPAVAAATPDSSSGGGGGCTLATPNGRSPIAIDLLLVLFVLLAYGGYMQAGRKGHNVLNVNT
jgi:cyclophilin family peptidyl-prolyl cis-trans isomerase